MLVYPEYPLPNVPVDMSIQYDILRASTSFSFSYKRKRAFRPKLSFTLNYSWLTSEQVEELYQFYMQVQSTEGFFYYITHSQYSMNDRYIGVIINPVEQSFLFPLYQWGSFRIKVNGEYIDSSKYTIYQQDYFYYIKFMNMQVGDLITVDFIDSRLVVYSEFAEDSLGIQHLIAKYSNIKDLKIVEVLNGSFEVV